jgi:hypothetical protein
VSFISKKSAEEFHIIYFKDSILSLATTTTKIDQEDIG